MVPKIKFPSWGEPLDAFIQEANQPLVDKSITKAEFDIKSDKEKIKEFLLQHKTPFEDPLM